MKINKIKNLPVFEILDIDFENNFDKDKLKDSWNLFFENGDSKRKRAPLSDDNLVFAKKLFKNINNIINPIVRESSFDWWPMDYINNYSFEITDEVGNGIYLDSPNFNMGIHVDNGLSFGTCILNLEDNIGAHTIYFDSEGNEIWRGPEKKGTGILHINQPNLLHTGINNSSKERYILMNYYKVLT